MLACRKCPQCGAIVEGDASPAVHVCAFCATALVAVDDVAAAVGLVVPFAIDREQAAARLRRRLRSTTFAPDALKYATRAESLRAVHVPFVAFAGQVRSTFRGRVAIQYHRGSGDHRSTHYEWFPFENTHVRELRDHLVCASRGLSEATSNRLEPFDLGQGVPPDPRVLAGVEVEHPSVTPEEAAVVARAEVETSGEALIRAEACAGLLTADEQITSDLQLTGHERVLLPLWVASYRGPHGPVAMFVNGQTGIVVGDVPRSSLKVGLAVVGGVGGVLAAFGLVVVGIPLLIVLANLFMIGLSVALDALA